MIYLWRIYDELNYCYLIVFRFLTEKRKRNQVLILSKYILNGYDLYAYESGLCDSFH